MKLFDKTWKLAASGAVIGLLVMLLAIYQGYDAWMRAFCNRKYESAFSREMNRSMEIYLKPFLEKEGVSDLEK